MTDAAGTAGAGAGAGGGNLFDMLGEEGLRWQREQEVKPDDGGPNATEGAKKKAEELKVDLAEVKGTGSGGRIVAGDVQKVATERTREKQRKKSAAGIKEPDVYDKDRVVLYAGHRIEVPTREMKLEEVRAQVLEEQFPELSKERTEMLYDEERGHIIPVLKGHRKGADGPIVVHTTVPPDYARKPVFHMLGGDGVYEIRQTQAGNFAARVESDRRIAQVMNLKVPPIPGEVLRSVVEGFRADPENEYVANVVYDRRVDRQAASDRYSVVWPDQWGSGTTVTADGTVETEDRFIVLQAHSHGRLPAFFSATDDADEVRTGLYGVVGRCHEDRPEMAIRYSCGGRYVPVHFPEQVFGGGLECVRFPGAFGEGQDVG